MEELVKSKVGRYKSQSIKLDSLHQDLPAKRVESQEVV